MVSKSIAIFQVWPFGSSCLSVATNGSGKSFTSFTPRCRQLLHLGVINPNHPILVHLQPWYFWKNLYMIDRSGLLEFAHMKSCFFFCHLFMAFCLVSFHLSIGQQPGFRQSTAQEKIMQLRHLATARWAQKTTGPLGGIHPGKWLVLRREVSSKQKRADYSGLGITWNYFFYN